MAMHRALRDRSAVCAPQSSLFWISVRNNFFNVAVLEWCKVFADKRSKYYYQSVMRQYYHKDFDINSEIGIVECRLSEAVKIVRHYRDKFVAHLDDEQTMHTPEFCYMYECANSLYKFVALNVPIYSREELGWSDLDQVLLYSTKEFNKSTKLIFE